MARAGGLYPPGPWNVPSSLTRPTAQYRFQVVVMLVSQEAISTNLRKISARWRCEELQRIVDEAARFVRHP